MREWISEKTPPTMPSAVRSGGPPPPLASSIHGGDDLGEHAPAALQRPWPCPERLDDRKPAPIALAVEELEQRRESRPNLLAPLRGLPVGRHDDRRDPLHRLVKRRQKTAFAVLELLVERPARHARAGDDMSDGRVPRPTLRRHVDHRCEDPAALDLGDLLVPVRVLALAAQPAVSGPRASGLDFIGCAPLLPGDHLIASSCLDPCGARSPCARALPYRNRSL
jgi:hypothetical protein